MRRVHVIVYGVVQGVFFRHNTKRMADKLNIKGFVRNANDGVEAFLRALMMLSRKC